MASHLSVKNPGILGRGLALVILCSIMPIIALVLVCCRMYSRHLTRAKYTTDDGLIIFAMHASGALSVSFIFAVHYGFGSEAGQASLSDEIRGVKLFFICQLLYAASMGATKLSILFSYRRVFFQPTFSYFAKVVIWIVSVFTICSLIATFFQCGSPSNIWESPQDEKCMNQTAFWYCNAAFNIVTDFVILGMPAATVMSLALSWKERLSLMCVLSCGGFVCLTSILRCISLNPANSQMDIPLAALKAANWSIVETNTGIIWACLPMMKPVLYRFFPRFFRNAFPDLSPPRETPIPLYNLLPIPHDRGLPPTELRSSEASYRVHTTDTVITAQPRQGQPLDLPDDQILIQTTVNRMLVPHANADRMSRGSFGAETLLTLEEWLGEDRRAQEAEGQVNTEAVGVALTADEVGAETTSESVGHEAEVTIGSAGEEAEATS